MLSLLFIAFNCAAQCDDQPPIDECMDTTNVARTGNKSARQPFDQSLNVGTLTGRFIFDGQPPTIGDLFPEFSKIQECKLQPGLDLGSEGLYRTFLDHGIRPCTDDQSLLVSKEFGVANMVIWAISKDIPWQATDDLGKRVLTIHLRNGNFNPRIATAVVGQPILVANHDPVGFHFRTELSRPKNKDVSQLLKPNSNGSPLSFVCSLAESKPAKYVSNLGPWAMGWLFVHANTFVAVSQTDGSFAIPHLPVGEWEFRVWHERQGFLRQWSKGKFQIRIKEGHNDLGEIRIRPQFLTRQ
jgi:hypothetical protein